jgi:cell volume regulation protein A
VVARWLHVALPMKAKQKSPVDAFMADGAKSFLREINIPEQNHSVGKRIVELQFPKKAIIAMISRDDQFITPNGNTVIEADDMLVVLTEDHRTMEGVYESLNIEPDFEEKLE